jgi:hypothetical protein
MFSLLFFQKTYIIRRNLAFFVYNFYVPIKQNVCVNQIDVENVLLLR